MALGKDRGITIKGARATFNSSFITKRRNLIYPHFCGVVDSHVERDFAKNIGTVPQLGFIKLSCISSGVFWTLAGRVELLR